MKESDVAGGAAQEVGVAPGGIGNRRGRRQRAGAGGPGGAESPPGTVACGMWRKR